jgi:hypothetical protein
VLRDRPFASMCSHPARTKTASGVLAAPRRRTSQKVGRATSSLEIRLIQSPVMLLRVKLYWPVRLTPRGRPDDTNPVRMGGLIAGEDVWCVVGAVVVGDQNFVRGAGLIQQRVERLAKKIGLVERGDANGK